jgi:hypothetical protein
MMTLGGSLRRYPNVAVATALAPSNFVRKAGTASVAVVVWFVTVSV